MRIESRGTSQKAVAGHFTGDVWFENLVMGDEPSRIRMAAVHFSPGARTAWHSHSLGQVLHVTEGIGKIQSRGGGIETIHVGDIVFTPAGEWHWHGAGSHHFMTHLAISEEDTRSSAPKTDWGDKVTEAEYRSE